LKTTPTNTAAANATSSSADDGAGAFDAVPGAVDLGWQGMPSLLSPDELARLTRPAPWRAMGAVAFDWCSWVLVAAIALRAGVPWLWPLAWVWIGSRLHALGVLAHDGAHGLLLPRRRWNDVVVELFLAWPVLLSPAAYRRLHRGHHRFLNTAQDPDWARNRPDELVGSPSWGHTLRVLLGLSGRQARLVDMMRPAGDDARPLVPPLRVLVLVVVVAVVAWRGWWVEALLVWAAPFAFWFLPSMRLKGIAEHFAVANTSPLSSARTVLPSPLERWLVAPHNVHFHVEHHLFPSIPCTRLADAHRALSRVPRFVDGAHLTRGYAAFLRECIVARRARRSAEH
jgi:fatty acid desaturase